MTGSIIIYIHSIYLAWSTIFNMSEIDNSSLQDLPSRVTVLETQILIHNKIFKEVNPSTYR